MTEHGGEAGEGDECVRGFHVRNGKRQSGGTVCLKKPALSQRASALEPLGDLE